MNTIERSKLVGADSDKQPSLLETISKRSLPLQIFLFYNWIYDYLYCILMFMCIYYTWYTGQDSRPLGWDAAHISVNILSILLELRLYLGYVGNLEEKVPQLFFFLLITAFPTIEIYLFLLFVRQLHPTPLETALHSLQFIFICFELIFGALAIRSLVQVKNAKFHLSRNWDELMSRKLD
eukprot:GHVL01024943.1.p1 GENE.GHVL01024943.1~~GHVL01024943.1.p1  ORF type:complete len:187 (+),score=15.84 GHVL01024943.1:22-561(+)